MTSAMRAEVTKAEVTRTTAKERGRMLLIRKNVFRELEPITSLGKFLFKESLLITLTTIQHVLVLHNVYTLYCCVVDLHSSVRKPSVTQRAGAQH